MKIRRAEEVFTDIEGHKKELQKLYKEFFQINPPPHMRQPTRSLEKLLSQRKSCEVVSGIYFLFMHTELQYIGQSKNVYSRIGAHRTGYRGVSKPNWFDSYAVHICQDHELNVLETLYILEFEPPLNTNSRGNLCTPTGEFPYRGQE